MSNRKQLGFGAKPKVAPRSQWKPRSAYAPWWQIWKPKSKGFVIMSVLAFGLLFYFFAMYFPF